MLPEQASKGDMADWCPAAHFDVDTVKDPVDIAKRWNPETAVYILANVGDEFCELKQQVSPLGWTGIVEIGTGRGGVMAARRMIGRSS